MDEMKTFRPMRRFKQQLPDEESLCILKDAYRGFLSVIGDGGYPYTIPINFLFEDGRLFFHSAKEGHKLDAIRNHEKVSFCVIAQDEVMPVERTTAYISVIAFGRARIVEDEPGLRRICEWIGEKFCPDHLEGCHQETDEVIAARRMYCVEIEVEHLTGKCGNEVLRRKRL